MELTKHLGQFVADLSANHLPEEATAHRPNGFHRYHRNDDGGREEDRVRIMTEVLATAGGPATLHFGPRKATAPETAWINGGFAVARMIGMSGALALASRPRCISWPRCHPTRTTRPCRIRPYWNTTSATTRCKATSLSNRSATITELSTFRQVPDWVLRSTTRR